MFSIFHTELETLFNTHLTEKKKKKNESWQLQKFLSTYSPLKLPENTKAWIISEIASFLK